MAETNLPYQYQSQIEAAERRKQLAEALQKQAFGFQGAQGGGRIAAKTSPLAWLANTATGYLSTEGIGKASEKQAQTRQAAEEARQAEMLALMQAPEDQQQTLGIQGKFPETRQLAGELYKRKADKLKAFADTIKDRDNQTAARSVLTGQLPGGDYTSPALPEPTFGTASDGSPYVTTTNLKGEKDVKYAPKGVQVTNQIPRAESRLGLDILEAGLKPREEAASAAKNVIATTNRAVDALERGAQAGGGEEYKQSLRKALQAFGTTVPATAETNELQMALGAAILTEAAKIKPISNTDIETLRSIVGSVNTDPNALTRALAFMQAESIRGLQNFEQYVSEQGSTLSDPDTRRRLAGVTVGMQLPNQLFGPPGFQMAVMQALKQGGGDVTRFTNTSRGQGDAKSGSKTPQTRQFEADATFDIRNPAASFPTGAKSATPAPAEQLRYNPTIKKWEVTK